ncbi:MAG: DUF1259 domain-containing protein [Longimicrobiales bacterium]
MAPDLIGRTVGLSIHALLSTVPARAQGTPDPPCEAIGDALGAAASSSGGVCRVTFPRGDLGVSLLGADLPAGMGLTSWVALHRTPEGRALVMGDLALTPEELPRVMSGLRQNGLLVTAVHRHMLNEQPAVVFMHYMAEGDAVALARSLNAALERAPSARGRAPATEATAMENGVVAGMPCARIEEILDAPAASADQGPGYCKVTLPRPEGEIIMDGHLVPPSMGIGSWFAFRETRDGRDAVIAGDMALREAQVNPAIAALREQGVEVVALHNHMLTESPRIVFFHFQARGAPEALARALRAGINAAARIAPVTGARR